jgi:multiple sugar transport system substrate-binding protein
MVTRRRSRPRRGLLAVAAAAGAVALAAGCSRGGSSGSQGSSGEQTIVFAESGLGTEGQATQAAINAFEKANPSIKVQVDVLSTDSTQYLQQLQQRFIAGSSTPDVFEADETYPASLAKSGWLYNLDGLHPDLGAFLPASLGPGRYNGATYAVPWFANTEGLFYRTDLINTPPASLGQLVSDARAAMKHDPSLKEGLAFEGAKYEGAITSFMVFAGGTGGRLHPADLNTPQNLQALQFGYDAIYKYHIAPQAVTGWKEGDVQQEFTSGHTPFAIDWPFVFATAKGTPVQGKIGFVPFLGSGGTLGIEMLAINGKTAHAQAAWKLIQYLTSAPAQVQRAVATGDPPSVSAAYDPALFAQAPYFKQVQQLAKVAAARPSSPVYLQISADLQTMFSSVYSNLTQPPAALQAAAGQVKTLAGSG